MLKWLMNWFHSSLLTEIDDGLHNALWPSQVYQVIVSKKQRALTTVESEQLLKELQEYFQQDAAIRATLAADVKILCFFVKLRFSTDPVNPATLGHLLDEEPTVSAVCYQNLVQQLFAAELKEWQAFFSKPAEVSLPMLRERLRIIQRLRYLEYPLMRYNKEASTLPPLDNLEESPFGHWFYHLLSTCLQQLSQILQRWIFGHDFSQVLRLKSTDYIAIADNVLQLIMPFSEQLGKNQQTHLFKTLHQWYLQGSQFWAQQSYFFTSELTYFPSDRRSWKDEFQFIQQSLQQDLEQLTQWAEFAFKGAFMQLQVDETQAINSYLFIYQQLQDNIRNFGIAAWAYRSRCEMRLRPLSSNKKEQQLLYLSRLQALDNALQQLFSKFMGIVGNGFSSFSYLDKNSVIEKIKRYFVHLDSKLQYLSSLTHWLHHSCYCCDATEGALTYEMNQQLRAANYCSAIRYQDRATVHTLTDHVVQCLGPKAWDKVLRKAFHSDKHPRYLAPIADYGFNQIQSLQKQAKQLITLWQQGQWASAAPTNTPQLTSSEPFLQPENQEEPALIPIEKPINPLDLSVLDFKAEFIRKIKAKVDLTKYPPKSNDFRHQLYEGQDNEQERELWQLNQEAQAIHRKQMKELAEIRRETAGHKQRTEEINRKIEKIKREKEEMHQKLEQIKREKEEMKRKIEQYQHEKEQLWQNEEKFAVATLTKELISTMEQQRPSTAEEVHNLLSEVIKAVLTKPEHEGFQIVKENWQEHDITNLLFKIINSSDDMHDLARLCLSHELGESTDASPPSQARNKERLFSESSAAVSPEDDDSLSPERPRIS